MKQLCLSLVKYTSVIFVLMVAGVLSVHSQELKAVSGDQAAERPAIVEDLADGRTADSRFALSAGGTPAIPVKGLRLNFDQATEFGFPLAANESPDQITTRPSEAHFTQTTAKQTSDQPYVFPTPKQRFNRYVKNVVGPFALFRVAASAGINQWKDHPEEWEQGASGYGKRFASSFGRNAIQHTVIYGLDSALGLDTGFRRSPSKEFGARLKHALLETITSRTKTGKRVISVPRIAGAYTAGVIAAETWYPERYNYKDGLRSGTSTMLTAFALNVIREFVVRF